MCRAKSYLTINSCLEEFLWTLSYQMGGLVIQYGLCLCWLDMQTLGKCFLIQPNYTLQAKVNLQSPKCPSPPSFTSLHDKAEGVKSFYLNVAPFAFHCVGNSSCGATENTALNSILSVDAAHTDPLRVIAALNLFIKSMCFTAVSTYTTEDAAHLAIFSFLNGGQEKTFCTSMQNVKCIMQDGWMDGW